MYVRQLIGRDAGKIIDMNPQDVVRAEGQSVQRLSEAESARYQALLAEVDEVEAQTAMMQRAPVMGVKRKRGWPKGKPRGPRKQGTANEH